MDSTPATIATPRVRSLPVVSAVAEIAVVVAAVVIGASALRPAFSDDNILRTAVPFAALGAAIAVVGRVLRRGPALVGMVGLVAYLVAAGAAYHRERTIVGVPTPSSVRAVLSDVANGWRELLLVRLPLDPNPTISTLVAFAAFTAALLGVWLLWTRWPLLGAVPPLALAVVALVVASPARPAGAVWAAALAAMPLLLGGLQAERSDASLAFTDRWSELRSVGRRLPTMVLVVAVLAAAASVVGSVTDDRLGERVALRDHLEPPSLEFGGVSPLVQLNAAVATDPAIRLFTVTGAATRIPIAVLSRYDGITWRTAPTFRPVGRTLDADPGDAPSGPVETVSLTFAVDRLGEVFAIDRRGGTWVPTVPNPTSISLDGVLYAGETGAAVAAAPVSGQTYTVIGAVPRPSDDALRNAGRGTDVDPVYLERPEGGEVIDAIAPRPASSTPIEELQELERFLHDTFFTAEKLKLKPGHSIGHLAEVLDLTKQRGGADEQFASAFALIARYRGFPSRVVVGADAPTGADSTTPREVLSSDLRAWPEVFLDGAGWVAFDPTPDRTQADAEQPDVGTVNATATSLPGDSGPNSQNVDQAGPRSLPPPAPDTTASVIRWAVVAVVLLLALVLLGPGLRLLRRRRRLRAEDPTRRTIGAWRELNDALHRQGIRAERSSTCADIAELARPRCGDQAGTALEGLVDLTDRAIFSSAGTTAEQAAEAWALEHEVAKALESEHGGARRLLGRLDPRPLVSR